MNANDELADLLTAALEPELGPIEVKGLERLTGGASRETWSFDAVDADGVTHELVLRRDPPRRPSAPGNMTNEANAIRAAQAAGLRVPEVVANAEGPDAWGSAGVVMRRVEGETLARRILRDDEYAQARPVLAAQCGEFLAGLHQIDTGAVPGLRNEDALDSLRSAFDSLAEQSPTFELAFHWLEEHRPAPSGNVIVHSDFRLGNLIVGSDGLRAVLDWELVHVGDPLEDMGWLCTKAWRFGEALPVGGFGTRDQLIDAYEAAGGVTIDRDAFHWWEVISTLKWGVSCIWQAVAHLSGAARSVELAAVGRRVCEQEWDLLGLLAPDAVAAQLDAGVPQVPTAGVDNTDGAPGAEGANGSPPPDPGLHGQVTDVELLIALREFLTDDVMPNTTGRTSFHARVASNVVAMVERQVQLGPAQAQRRATALSALGVSSETELSARVREGAFEDRKDQLLKVLVEGVADKVAVANPRYLRRP